MTGELTEGFKLSPQQRQLWDAQPKTSPYSCFSIDLDAPLDEAFFTQTLRSLVNGKEIFALHVQCMAGVSIPLQVIGQPLPLRKIDLTSQPSPTTADFMARLQGALEEAIYFSLSANPDGRATLFIGVSQLHLDTHGCLIFAEHLVRALAGGAPWEGNQAIDYLDLAEWLNANLTPESNYYNILLDHYSVLDLHWRRADDVAAAGPYQVGSVNIELGERQKHEIAEFINAHDLSENQFYFTAWVLTLREISRANSFVVAYRDSCRQFDELADVLGPLSKTLAVGVNLPDTVRFLEIYHSLQQRLEALDIIGLPVPQDSPAHQAMVNRCGYEYNVFSSTALRGKEERLGFTRADPGELLLNILRCNETLAVELRWNPLRYDPAVVNYISQVFCDALQFALGSGKDMGDSLYRSILLGGTQTGPLPAVDIYREHHSFIEIFERQVRLHPDAVAIQTSTHSISYLSLNQRINRLARSLSAEGVTQGARVGICLSRSDLLIIAMFAVAKLGAAYVPIDTTTPENRIAHMLADAAVHLTIVNEKTHHLIKHTRTMSLDQHQVTDPAIDAADLGLRPNSVDLAYILYTSGSTGRPKGVLIEHGNLLNYLLWSLDFYQVSSGIGSPFFTSIGFDATITSIFPALLCGKKVVVIEDAEDTQALKAIFQSVAPFSLIKITPTHLNLLLDEFAQDAPYHNAPRYFVVGGEALTTSLANRLARLAPNSILVNEYGPTETVVGCMQHVYDSRRDTGAAVPIGRAIANMQVLVLDANRKIVPPGVIGEIYIAGAGVGRGYNNLPEQTHNRFLTLTDSGSQWHRFYQSGDLASYGLDGIIEYHGRADDQVKINGYRIELDEIQRVLDTHLDIKDSYVLTRQDPEKNKTYICALVRLNDNQTLDPNAIKQYLRGYLPSYMIPQSLHVVEKFPLNQNGKIDKKELLALIDAQARPDYVAPATPVEMLLTSACGELLKISLVGMEDNFFDLGGDSILAIQLISALKVQGYPLNFEDIYNANSLRELALRVGAPSGDFHAPGLAVFALVAEQDRSRLPAEVLDAYPITQLQLGLLFHHQLSQQSALYHDIDSIKIRGHFDQEKIQRIISYLVAKHPVLRTSFHLNEYSVPLQLVHAGATIEIDYLDYRYPGEHPIIDPVADWIAQDKERGFNIGQPGLMRLLAVVHDGGVFQIVISRHHAILDGWSAASLMTEFMSLYSSPATDIPSGKPEADAGFVNYVAAELSALGNEDSREFWRNSLKDFQVPSINGSFLRGRAVLSQETSSKIKITRRLPSETATRINQLARMLNVPVKEVFLAAHLNLIGYLTQCKASLSGVITHGRSGEGDQGSLGLFLNTLPFPHAMRPISWRECILEIFATEKNMIRHRHFPIAAIADGNIRDINILFNFVRFHVYEKINALKDFEILAIESYEATHFKLMVNVVQDPESINEFVLELYFDKHEITPGNMERLMDYYLHTLQVIHQDPEGIIDCHQLMPPAERARMHLVAGSASGPVNIGDNLVALIERQALATPDAVALVANGVEYSYQAINGKANALASGIIDRYQTKLGSFIGVCMDRNANLIITMLAILKAGYAYLPLDPKYPQERLQYMLSDAKPTLIMVDANNATTINPQADQLLVDETRLASNQTMATPISLSADSPAYIIYTSGSTGQPKGVVIRHSNALSLMRWVRTEFTSHQMGSMLASTSICFDLSVFEIFGPLSVGGKLVLVDSVLGIAEVARHQVTFINTVPSAMQELVAGAMLPPSVTTIGLAGEPLPPDLVEKIFRHSSAEVYNLYGPSEDTTYTTVKKIVREEAIHITIGRPLPGKRLYILDEERALVPFGSQGELYVGGDGLAKEYLNKPDLTAQKFIIQDLGDGRVERLYSTGDTVRYNTAGDLEYLNRRDNQIKIRGYRIELGEIEQVIGKLSWVEKVVVHHFDDDKRGKYLVAYIVAGKPDQFPDEVTRLCRQYLPAYMCPSQVVFLDKFPLTENGKVDRKALKAPAASRGDRGKLDFELPTTDMEKYLCDLWKNELSLPELSINDNFFDVGGNSLVLLRIHSMVASSGKCGKVSILDFFNYPTIKQLARYLAAEVTPQGESTDIASRAMRKKQFIKSKKVLP